MVKAKVESTCAAKAFVISIQPCADFARLHPTFLALKSFRRVGGLPCPLSDCSDPHYPLPSSENEPKFVMSPQYSAETIRSRTKKALGSQGRAERLLISISGVFAMNINFDFQMVCGDCGSLAIRIENPEGASREEIVYCGDCGCSRGTVGALRDLAVLPYSHEIVALHNELQSLRRKVQIAESRFQRTAGPDVALRPRSAAWRTTPRTGRATG
jgi:hypothetical protein